MLPAFFAANAVLTAVLIPVLQVRDPTFSAFPWIFAGAFVVTLVPVVRHHLTSGALPWRLAPAALYAGVISLASSVSGAQPTGVSGNVFHPVEFAGLAFLAQLAAHRGFVDPPRRDRLLWAALGCVAFGVLDELHQHFVPRRAATVEDVLLDTLGVAIGTLVFLGARRVLHRQR
ncbi:MAG: VanZ family protein [bacterium]